MVDQLPNRGREAEMLQEMGLSSMEDLFSDIPADVRFSGELPLPGPQSEEEIIILGDFNVIPQYNDCKTPTHWTHDALFDSEVRTKFHYLINLGYLDCIRILDESNSIFTQWDYRDRAWEENNGVRIDHILLNPNAADRLEDSWIDSTLRSQAKPSDHVPVWVSLNEK